MGSLSLSIRPALEQKLRQRREKMLFLRLTYIKPRQGGGIIERNDLGFQ